jgi:hypothetical protein
MINPKYDYCEEKDQTTHMCLWTRSLQRVVCCVWKKCVVSWEVEVARRRCKAVVVTTMKPGFTEALRTSDSMRAFMYAHDITERDQANIVHIESLLFNLKRKGATKQIKINDFLKKNTK